jgi:spore maturation protein CgeB
MFEPTDVPFVKETLDLDADFLTLAFGPKRYYKKQLPIKYDASFVGSHAAKREEYLDAMIGLTDNVAICGDFYRAKSARVKGKTIRANVPSTFANDLYSSSKVNVNIHIPQSKEGFSVRTFEIIGAGGFELVERQKARLLYFEEGKHMEFYDSKDEFLDKVRYYIDHDAERQRIADAGHRLALEKHTWKARFAEMLTKMNLPVTA